jgi:hypothetical protein
MSGIFISYAREDGDTAEKLEEVFRGHGIQVWRDQESIYAGEHWPEAIGRGIAGQRIFLLLWSKNSAVSHFVGFEWNTALALQKTVVPVFLDNAPLPAALSAKNGVLLEDFDQAVKKILDLMDISPPSDHRQNLQVMDHLSKIEEKNVETVLERVKTIYHQQGWQVHGNVYQVSRGDIININWWGKWQAKVIFFAVLLTLFTLIFDIPGKAKKFYQEIFGEPIATLTLKGSVLDSEGLPVGGAKVVLDLLPGEPTTTTSDGGFIFKKVPGKVGDRVRVSVYYKGSMRRNEYVTLPGPIRVILENL